MKKTIVNYDKDQGFVIDCTQIKESEHKQAMREVSELGFTFESIDADSFRADCATATETMIPKLEELGYSF